jgi:hypothetical protein
MRNTVCRFTRALAQIVSITCHSTEEPIEQYVSKSGTHKSIIICDSIAKSKCDLKLYPSSTKSVVP